MNTLENPLQDRQRPRTVSGKIIFLMLATFLVGCLLTFSLMNATNREPSNSPQKQWESLIAALDEMDPSVNAEKVTRTLNQALEFARSLSHEEDPKPLEVSLQRCGHWEMELQQYDRAVQHFSELVSLLEDKVPRDDLGLALAERDLGVSLIGTGQFQAGSKHLETTLEHLSKVPDADPQERLSIYKYLAVIYADLDEPANVATALERIYEWHESSSDPDLNAVASTLNLLSQAYLAQKQLELATRRIIEATALINQKDIDKEISQEVLVNGLEIARIHQDTAAIQSYQQQLSQRGITVPQQQSVVGQEPDARQYPVAAPPQGTVSLAVQQKYQAWREAHKQLFMAKSKLDFYLKEYRKMRDWETHNAGTLGIATQHIFDVTRHLENAPHKTGYSNAELEYSQASEVEENARKAYLSAAAEAGTVVPESGPVTLEDW